jgi:prepilin-type N-terminal cleavage/methylation domain-containing protein
VRRKSHNAAVGFTIIESLVVLLIIVLLASIAIPGAKMWSEQKSLGPGQPPRPKATPAQDVGVPPRDQANAGGSPADPLANE